MSVLVAFAFDNSEMSARGYSLSGPTLTPLPGVPPLVPPDPACGLRDPSVARYGGYYYLAATKPRRAAYLGTGATTLQLYRSHNLVDWTPLPDLPAGVSGATRAWAPELFVDVDGGVYVYYAVTTDTTEDAAAIAIFSIYARQALDDGLTSWSAPTKQIGLVAPKVIDPHVTRIDDPRGTHVMFYKDETALRVCRAWSNSPLGPWLTDRAGDWLGDGTPTEGPQLMPLPDGGWRLFTDRYATNWLTYRDSLTLDTWTAPTFLTYQPSGLRHPGYLWLSDEEWVALVERARTVRVYNTAPASVPHNQITAIPFTHPQGDTALWAPQQPTRLVAPAPDWYAVHHTLSWDVNGAGHRSTALRFGNGVIQWKDSRAATGGGMGTEHGGSDTVWLNSGEYLEVLGLQTSGGSLGARAVASFTKAGG